MKKLNICCYHPLILCSRCFNCLLLSHFARMMKKKGRVFLCLIFFFSLRYKTRSMPRQLLTHLCSLFSPLFSSLSSCSFNYSSHLDSLPIFPSSSLLSLLRLLCLSLLLSYIIHGFKCHSASLSS